MSRDTGPLKSRSEQAPGSGFHPRDKSEKNYSGFLGPPYCDKKVDLGRYVIFGAYDLSVTNVAHHIIEKLIILNKFTLFFSKISLTFKEPNLFQALKTTIKKV